MNRLLRDAIDENNITRKENGIYYFYIVGDKEVIYYMLRIEKYKNTSSIIIDYYMLKNGKMIKHLTGTGHVQKVYSTLLKLGKEYIDNNKPEEFCFNSEEDHKKFNTFYSKAISSLFPDYTLKIFDDFNLFLFSRVEEGPMEKDLKII